MRAMPARYPIPGPLSLGEFEAFLEERGPYPGIRIEEAR
jgi:hypothetical protein